jgi:hypothetical protein
MQINLLYTISKNPTVSLYHDFFLEFEESTRTFPVTEFVQHGHVPDMTVNEEGSWITFLLTCLFVR